MNQPVLDKIIGSSPITNSNFDMHHLSGACAFPSHGFLSILLADSHQRSDIKIADDFREISALKFSQTDNQIAVGESGLNARIFILSFDSTFDKIVSQTVLETKENGFSALAFNSEKGRLISIGTDYQPYLILWDLNHSFPIKIGYYHLKSQPNSVIFNMNCTLAVVSGEGLLRLFKTTVDYKDRPLRMISRSANIGNFENSRFVGVSCTSGSQFSIYALCNEGTLCVYDSISDQFIGPGKGKLNLRPIKLNRGFVTALSADDSIILCGSEKGPIYAFKNDDGKFKVAGKFVAVPEKVISVGVSEKYIATAFNDGHILFWDRDQNGKPELNLFSHRGPICKIHVIKSTGKLVTCGSDNCVRLWELRRHRELISRSTQEMLFYRRFDPPELDYMTNICGVRAATNLNNNLIAGCSDGNIYILNIETFEDVVSFIDNVDSVTALAASEKMQYFASGGGDGLVRLYTLEGNDFTLVSKSKKYFPSCVTSLVFTDTSLIASSSNGIKFFSLPDLKEYYNYPTSEPILSLSFIEKANLVVSAGCDRCISFFDSQTGKLFNRYLLSNNFYPVAIDTHDTGLVIAAALSNGNVLVIDTITGDTLFSFDSLIGIVTSIVFHENDLVMSSYSGCIARWNLPDSFHIEIAKKHDESPINDLLASVLPNKPTLISELDIESHMQQPSKPISNSIVGNKAQVPNWIFQKDHSENENEAPININNVEAVVSNENEQQDEDEDKSGTENDDIDAPRPPINDVPADEIIRSSICSRKALFQNKSGASNALHIISGLDNKPSTFNMDDMSSSEEEEIIEVLRIPNQRHSRIKIPSSIIEKLDDECEKKKPNSNKSSTKKEEINKDDVKTNEGSIMPLKPEDMEAANGPFLLDSSSDDENEEKTEQDKDKLLAKPTKSPDESIDEHQKMADDINQTAKSLKQAFEEAKQILSMKFTDDKDKEAQKLLQDLLDSFNTQKQRRDELKKNLESASKKMEEATKLAEQASTTVYNSVEQFSSSLSPQ
ncbi:hypothetical protein TRFO_18957 [Tritrichomonas foetus]|uniref:Uncharacterized protein n=1 Tax=Tritrichomonas foetus TaxID=1144522 RepID=A0A1J4KJV9_9EUKA|nr:hypothetical protein TRFO_18957 [Tritrichomonas foetus]|eukprot:OHT11515.1 hypothetical protein TRFO_18957 [Tritrichomonas foetus]